jgi:hypothetical protein
MNVEIGTEAAQFPEKEYINGIFAAVQDRPMYDPSLSIFRTLTLPSIKYKGTFNISIHLLCAQMLLFVGRHRSNNIFTLKSIAKYIK